MSADLAALIRRRGNVKQKLTNFGNFLDRIRNNLNEVNKEQLAVRSENLNSFLVEYDSLHDLICNLCSEEEMSVHLSDQMNFENALYEKLTESKLLLRNSFHTPNTSSQSVKLPIIELPKFSGSLEKWLEFKDVYESLIHENQSLSDIQKFHYLRSAVSGTAAQLIASIEFSSINYELAWQAIFNRFNNKGLLINNHVRAIVDSQSVSKESAVQIRKLIDTVDLNLRALQNLGEPVEHWDRLIIYLISKKLDTGTLREWEQNKKDDALPTYNEFRAFLNKKAELLQTIESNSNVKSFKQVEKVRAANSFVVTAISCNFCKANHTIYKCDEFKALSVQARLDKVKALKLCKNCLRIGHTLEKCVLRPCIKCKQKHNSLLHLETTPESVSGSSVTLTSQVGLKQVLLSTAVVELKSAHGNFVKCRALIDNGAQANFISRSMLSKLGILEKSINISIAGIGGQVSSHIKSQCTLNLRSSDKSFNAKFDALIINSICGDLPEESIDITSLEIPSNIKLADSEFYASAKIDLLLGCTIFWDILCKERMHFGKDLPGLYNTKLGWIIAGQLPAISNTSLHCGLSVNIELNNQIKRFWEIEDAYITETQDSDVQDVSNKHFLDNYSRLPNGRFVVKIPFNSQIEKIGDSYKVAYNRLLGTERRFESDPNFKRDYVKFIKDYQDLGHMSKIDPESDKYSDNAVYLPHHGVIKNESTSTKLRVVFDGSIVTDSGISLNQAQLVGPTIQDDLLAILLRFRQHKFIVMADIRHMYRQVLIHESQRHYQRILWRDNPNESIQIFELNTVTYGTASAPYLAIRSLYQLALDNAEVFPVSSEVISHSFYVDDLITGSDNTETLHQICNEVYSILRSGCFELCKWRSNSAKLLSKLPNAASTSEVIFGPNNAKTLGISYNCEDDILSFKTNIETPLVKITKRSILSNLAKIYDPLGLLSPFIVSAKLIVQELWTLKVSWDEEVPSNIKGLWDLVQHDLIYLESMRIPRHIVCQSPKIIEYHGFCDSSTKAYGACIYLRSIDYSNKVQISLICSRSRVAPLKVQTIPRLELCGAVLLTNLMEKVCRSLTICEYKKYFWCDSQVVLHWINSSSNRLEPFVANRIAKVQAFTKSSEWFYIPSKENPADVISRSSSLRKLWNNKLWWFGPEFLSNPDLEVVPFLVDENFESPETKGKYQTMVACIESNSIFTKYSSLSKLTRVFAYCLRFIQNCKISKFERCKNGVQSLTVIELEVSLAKLIALAQIESFEFELSMLLHNKQLPAKNRLCSLSPFLDDKSMLRVGGRLQQSEFSYDVKHPLLLHSKHPLTVLLFREEHKRLMHVGPQQLLANIRHRYWPIGGRNLAKQVVHKCLKCYRFNAKPSAPIMGALPKDRTRQAFPFEICGVDYGGPLLIKNRKGRGAKVISKAYICLFICFITKAIHIEAVTELSTTAFLATLKRFVSRRGLPKRIYSDNGTNFLGARNELNSLGQFFKDFNQEMVTTFATNNIEWQFIPPHSPHLGGLWEAGIKSAKHCLKRVTAEASMTFEELMTILTQIESSLNSRPLSILTSTPNDPEPLTPGHFLIGRPLMSVPERNWVNLKENLLTRYQYLQRLHQHFWKRWSDEYITDLQRRVKWKINFCKLKTGDVVLIKEDNLPPARWLLGRVVTLHLGKDGVPRVVSIKTNKGIIRRSVMKICPLPISDETETESIN